MTIYELCKMINLPQGVVDQLQEYENVRKDDIPADVKEKLFEAFRVEAMRDGEFETVYEGTVIGHKRIIPFREGLVTNSLRIVITDSRMEPTIAFLGIYEHV